MENILDNSEINEVMNILENMSDEELSVQLLREFNNKTKELGTLLMNKDQNLDHGEWKTRCDDAKKAVDKVIEQIMKHK